MVKWRSLGCIAMKVRKIKDDSLVDPYIQELSLEQIEKENYDHFMLKYTGNLV
jgi:hypothetical protein